MEERNGNVKYKDRFFRFLFGNERFKENTLSLYNSLNGSDYSDLYALEFNTLDDVIYMGMKNDVSFLIDAYVNLYEHQSTYNPNLPLRGLFYFGKVYENYVNERKLSIYGKKKVLLPTPQFYVFYNGRDDEPDRKELLLSELFEKGKGAVEVSAIMLNINYGRNRELMEKCKALHDYAYFVSEVRRYRRDMSFSAALGKVVEECIQKGIFTEVFKEFRTEVESMLLTEYDEEETMNMFYHDGKEDGIEEGMEKGRKDAAALMNFLWKSGRGDSAEKAAKDQKYLEQLLKEFEETGKV